MTQSCGKIQSYHSPVSIQVYSSGTGRPDATKQVADIFSLPGAAHTLALPTFSFAMLIIAANPVAEFPEGELPEGELPDDTRLPFAVFEHW